MPMKDKARIVRWYEHLDEEIGKWKLKKKTILKQHK
jgi:hypothetical protein